jgi:nucleoid DNA-binding protein
MDELIKLVAKKAGISEAQARKAVQTVLDFIQQNLPAPVAAQVEAAMKGDLSGLEGLAGNLFGKK